LLTVLFFISCSRSPVSDEKQESQEVIQEKISRLNTEVEAAGTEVEAAGQAIYKSQEAIQEKISRLNTEVEAAGQAIYNGTVSSLNQTSTISTMPSQKHSLDTSQQEVTVPVSEDDSDSEQSNAISSTPQELLDMKLANPKRKLSTTQSISLIEHCAQLGEEKAAFATDKKVVMVLGNTGAGKSTFLNYLMGARMELVYPEDLDLPGEQKVVVVAQNSPRPEIMPIGHEETSKTFMPQMATDPDNTTWVYCDCPGFADNRGPEINISNALSINRILQRSGGVKAVFLANYRGLSVDRGNSIQAMEDMCHQMFGSADNLRRHQNAVLLGITKAPIYNSNGKLLSLNNVRVRLNRTNTPTAQILASRSFLFDPLDRRENPDFWSRERCRTEIAQLSSIPQQEATTMFQTVLIANDRTKLLEMARQLRHKLANAITQGDEASLRNCWLLLQRLRVIRHHEVETIIQEDVLPTLKNKVLKRIGSFKNYANAHDFDLAEEQLDLLTTLQDAIPDVLLELDLNALRNHLKGCRKKYTEQKRLEASREEARRTLEAMERQRIINLWEQREAERRALEEMERQRINNLRELERLRRERRAWEQQEDDSRSIL